MIFTQTKLTGAYVIDLERREDSRGFFSRMFCQQEFTAHGLKPVIAQANVGSNLKRGTLRGMHFQYPPAAETKYVRCTRGAILDILVDSALKAREAAGTPVRVGLVGAGFMVQGLANMIVNATPGMRLVAISNRHPDRASTVFKYAGQDAVMVESAAAFEQAASAGR